MPFNFKTEISNLEAIKKATQARIRTDPLREYDDREVSRRVNKYLGAANQQTFPGTAPGSLISSTTWREFFRDAKYFINLMGLQSTSLDSEVRNLSDYSFALLSDIQHEAESINVSLIEEEIKIKRNYSTVHHNTFTRERDMGLGEEDPQYLIDPKTAIPMLKDYVINPVVRVGATLPIREVVNVPIVDVLLVGEETDFGDSGKPILTSDPRSVMRPEKVFRHVIMKTEHDSTGRLYNYQNSFVTFLLELPTVQLVNTLTLQPLGNGALHVDSVKYIDEAGDEISLITQTFSADTDVVLLIQPIRTKYLKVKVQGFTPITKTRYTNADDKTRQVNQILKGLRFETFLPGDSSSTQDGRILDFSIKGISVGLNVYHPVGIFRSKPVAVVKPAAAEFVAKVSDIDGVATTVLEEFYLVLDLKDKDKNQVLLATVPLADSFPTQEEFLVTVGKEASFKLFPDLLHTYTKNRVVAAVSASQTTAAITTESAHGYIATDLVPFTAGSAHGLNGEFEVTSVVDTLNFVIDVTVYDTTFDVDLNTTPRVQAYSLNPAAPLTISKDSVALTIGTDYQISINGGQTFLTTFPALGFLQSFFIKRAGQFVVKIISHDFNAIYSAQYTVANNQYLSRNKFVKLINGRVVLDESLWDTTGEITTVAIVRSTDRNPYKTTVVNSYTLKVSSSGS